MEKLGSAVRERVGRITMREGNRAKKDGPKKDGPKIDERKKAEAKKSRPGKVNPEKTKPEKGKPEKSTPGPLPAGGTVEAFLACARAALGGVYCTPAREPACTDCSGLVRRCYREATGREITGDSHEQIKMGAAVDRSDVQPGDLLFWDTMGGREVRGGNAASHVGIASGGNRMFNALNEDLGIQESDLGSNYWMQQVKYLGARRLEF